MAKMPIAEHEWKEGEWSMKWLSLIVAVGLVFGVVGCKGETEKKEKNKSTVKGEGGKELSVSTSPDKVALTPGGDEKSITVKVERKNFDDAVKVTISDLPEGVTADEKTKEIPKGNNDVKFTLKAGDDAKETKGQKASAAADGGGLKKEANFTVDVAKKK